MPPRFRQGTRRRAIRCSKVPTRVVSFRTYGAALRRLYPRLRNPITSFTGKHDFLALDYPVSIVYKRKTYPSVAAVMQAEKARLGDTEYRKNLKEILGLALHHKFRSHLAHRRYV